MRTRSTLASKVCAISKASYNSTADSSIEQSHEEFELTDDVSRALFSARDIESLSGKLESFLRTFILPLIS